MQKNFSKKLKASQKDKNSGRCLLILAIEHDLDSCGHHQQYAFSLGVFNAREVEENQYKNYKEESVKNITFSTVFCTYYLIHSW